MSRKEIVWEVEKHSPTPYPEIEGWDEDIVETAGFVPLEVRFKQMEQAGIRAQFFESEFSSKNVQDMYLNHPEFDLSPEDDFEDAFEKMQLRAAWIEQVKEEVRKRKAAETDLKMSESKAETNNQESSAENENS